MKMQLVRSKAREIGIRPGKLNKLNLIRRIQQTEGNFDCFGTAVDGYCDQADCLWREDCLKLSLQQSA